MSRDTIKYYQSELARIRAARAAGEMSRHMARIEAADLLWRLRGGGL